MTVVDSWRRLLPNKKIPSNFWMRWKPFKCTKPLNSKASSKLSRFWTNTKHTLTISIFAVNLKYVWCSYTSNLKFYVTYWIFNVYFEKKKCNQQLFDFFSLYIFLHYFKSCSIFFKHSLNKSLVKNPSRNPFYVVVV